MVSTVKYYFRYKIPFSTRKPRFRCKYWYFLLRNGLFNRIKTGISTSFFLQNLRFLLYNTISDIKKSFRRENLVFGVNTGIFITKRSFKPNKNQNFYKFFSTKSEVSTVKYYFRYEILFSTRKSRFRC